MPVDFQITDEGPPEYTYPEVRAANVEDWRAAFGADANTDPETTDGQLVDIYTLGQQLLWQAALRLWADSFVRTARGAGLDGLLDMFGKSRIPASPSLGTAVFFGDELTPVALGTQVEGVTSGNLFEVSLAGSTGADLGSDVWMVQILPPIGVGVTYTVNVAGTDYDHLVGAPEEPADVADALRALINAGPDGTGTRAGVLSNGNALLVIDVTGGPGVVTATDDSGSGSDPTADPAVRLEVQAVQTGPLVAPAGSLQILPSPIAGIDGVSNDQDATQGRGTETDDEFRSRHLASLFGPGCGTDQAIRQRVLDTLNSRGLTFVETANVTSNRSNVVDSEGRPPHSFETVLRYGTGTPSDADQLVAQAIASCMPAGIEPFGLSWTESVEVFPGNVVDVSATLVTTLYLHLEITITQGEGFPTEGDVEAQVAANVTNAWDSITIEGKDYQRTTSFGPVNQATDNASETITILSDLTALPTDVPAFANVDTQPASAREIIDLDASRVTVIIVP